MQFQRIIRLALSALILFALLLDTSGLVKYPFVKQLENWAYDARLNFTRPNTVDNRIVIVDIDENSMAKVGRWPWGRDKLATIVDNLFDYYQVNTVGFDIVFAEKDESSGLEAFENLADTELSSDPAYQRAFEKIRPSLQYDRIFADSLEGRNVVLGYYFKPGDSKGESGEVGLLPPPIMKMDVQWGERLAIEKAAGYGANLEILQTAARSGGYFDNPHVSPDGVFRRIPIIQRYQSFLYSSLALAVIRAFLNQPQVEFIVESAGARNAKNYFALEAIKLGDYRIPVDDNGSVYVPYRGLQGSFPYLSAHQVLSREIDPALLKDKIVLIGTSAPGLLDLRSTPVQNVYPGVEVHANIISGILDQRINHKPAWTIGYEFVLLIVVAVSMAILLPLLSPLMAA
ncbi:MAG: CHASE2 domain-containing protein, partial [Gammaproteobacteria bacterium]